MSTNFKNIRKKKERIVESISDVDYKSLLLVALDKGICSMLLM